MAIKAYYQLTKPGIIYGNIMTTAAGYLLASRWHIQAVVFLAVMGGTSLVIASACVCNNYMDRDIDRQMVRTNQRALVAGLIPVRNAIVYAALLGIVGAVLLGLYVNALTLTIGLIGFMTYVFLYGIAKRRSVHGTLIGSIAGAAPIVAGYAAARGRLDTGAFLVFLIMVIWQMPHFYAIAMYRLADYKAAKLPVLPVVKGLRQTKIQIIIYTIAYLVASSLLGVFGYVGYSFEAVMAAVGLGWLYMGITGLKTTDDIVWARAMFFSSLIVVGVLSVMLAVGPLLP